MNADLTTAPCPLLATADEETSDTCPLLATAKKMEFARKLLYFHDILTDAENEMVRRRIRKWMEYAKR